MLQPIQGKQFSTASWAVNAISASWSPTQPVNTGSLVNLTTFNSFTSSYSTGSFIGSFEGTFTGSFKGTGSWSENTISASYAVSASWAPIQSIDTSSFATTGSNVFFGNQNIKGSVVEGSGSSAIGDYSHAEGLLNNTYGKYSHAEGSSNNSVGDYSHAEGERTTSQGPFSHAEGYTTVAVGQYAHAEGTITSAQGQGSHAEGEETGTLGQSSHSEGLQTVAAGDYSHAEGINTSAQGQGSHAEGLLNNTYGKYSHAEGSSNNSVGDYSHAEGYNTSAQGQGSHAEGSSNNSVGRYSHAEGEETGTLGQSSHSEGLQTLAIGDYSHTEGIQTEANGYGSHSEGIGTIALAKFQHVQGKFNQEDSENEGAFIVGNGLDNSNRSNLIKAYSNTVEITGSLLVTGSLEGNLIGSASYAVSASWAPTQNFNTSSLVQSTTFNSFTSSYNTGSFTGSFKGSLEGSASYALTASNLTGPAASKIYNGTTIVETGTGSITFKVQGTLLQTVTTTGVEIGGQVGVGGSPDSSAQIDISSTTKGILIPRQTTTQRDAIPSPASQLLLANTTKKTLDMYTGTSWQSIAGDFGRDLLALQLLGSPIKSVPVGSVLLPSTGAALSTSRSYFSLVYVDKGITTTGSTFYQATQGNFTANNFNGLALYSYSGGTITQIAISANDGNIWKNTSGVWVQVPWTSTLSLEPGIYFIGALYSSSAQTTAPVVGIISPAGTGNYCAPLTTNSARVYGGVIAGVTSLPLTQTLSTWNSITFYLGLYLY